MTQLDTTSAAADPTLELAGAAFEAVQAEIDALPDEQARAVNVEPMAAVTTALGVIAELRAFRPQFEKTFVSFDFVQFDKLGLYALAFGHVHGVYRGMQVPKGRAYANNGAGYCIGFRASDFEEWNPEGSLPGMERCHYGRQAIESLLKNHFAAQIALRRPDIVSYLAMAAQTIAAVAKHEHFAEEREWRSMIWNRPLPQHRIGKFGLTPYELGDKVSIEEVWLGPGVGPDPVVAKRMVQNLLGRNDIEAKVECWMSPYRG